MKTLIAAILIASTSYGQLPYEWNGSDPNWTASNNSNTTLSWQNGAGAVSTSNFVSGNWLSYDNSQNSCYTSPAYNMVCGQTDKIHVTMTLQVNLENGWDFLYFEHSQDGGATWVTIGTYTGAFFANLVYDLDESINTRFRFRFASDGSVNSYCSEPRWWGCADTSIYYADILDFKVECISYLPVELIEFTANNRGLLYFSTATELNNDYFILDKSTDGKAWNQIAILSGQGSTQSLTEYNFNDNDIKEGITYYKLTQVDFDGQSEMLGIRSVQVGESKVVKTINLMGQEVNDSYKGVVIEIYENGDKIKMLR